MILITDPKEIARELETLVEHAELCDPRGYNYIIPLVKEGDLFVESVDLLGKGRGDTYFVIDDLTVPDEILDDGNISMERIKAHFNHPRAETFYWDHVRSHGSQLPFGVFKRAGVGECLPMSLTSQLYFQERGEKSFICHGKLGPYNPLNGLHAWNLRQMGDGSYQVWDCAQGIDLPIVELLKAETFLGAQIITGATTRTGSLSRKPIIHQIGGLPVVFPERPVSPPVVTSGFFAATAKRFRNYD